MTHEEAFVAAERAGVDAAFTRADADHPVGLFLGIEKGQRALMVVCPEPPPQSPSLAVITVETRQRSSGDWALVLRLEQRDLRLLFARLVEDLEEATRARPEHPGEVVVERLMRWQRLLARRRNGLLEEHALRGLAAELSFLLDEAIPARGADSSTLAWRGPFSAPKDFAWADVEVEVKALHAGQRSVTISSLEQLTLTGPAMRLWCKVVETSSAEDKSAISAADLVQRVRSATATCAPAAERLELALDAAGWEDHDEYRTRFLRFGEPTCHEVRDTFPRIERRQVSAGVCEASYSLRIEDLKPFIVNSWEEVS